MGVNHVCRLLLQIRVADQPLKAAVPAAATGLLTDGIEDHMTELADQGIFAMEDSAVFHQAAGEATPGREDGQHPRFAEPGPRRQLGHIFHPHERSGWK